MTEEILIRFINNACTDEELIAVRNWLTESDDNAAKLFEMEKIVMLTGSMHDNTGRRQRVYEDIQGRIIAHERLERRQRRFRIYKWSSVAAAVAAVVVTAVIIFSRHDVNMITVDALAENKTVTLPDGSVVYLNKNSQLVYPEKFSDERDVSLTGEGFFKVAHDKEHPFTVNGRYINVTVLGTEFNFNSRESDNNNVSLVEGSVKVSSVTGNEGVVLVPGQKAEYDVVTGNITVSETNPHIDAAWHNRVIPFDNSSIAEIVKALEQLYDIKIRLEDVDLTATYSGATVYYENVDSTLRQLSNTLPITYSHIGGDIVVSSKK